MNIGTIGPRHAEDRNRLAEDLQRLRRLDRDRIIAAALDVLLVDTLRYGNTINAYQDIAAFAGVTGGNETRGEYTRELLAEIRAELSPLSGYRRGV